MMDAVETALPLFGSVRAHAYGKLRYQLAEARKLAIDLQEFDWVNVFHEMSEACGNEIRTLIGPL